MDSTEGHLPGRRWRAMLVHAGAALALGGTCAAALAAPFAYIPNSGTDNVSVIDLATNAIVATVAVGDEPQASRSTPADRSPMSRT